jgi:ubiquinone/menaquinone biosynthesis C-methylase UbiE
VRNRLELYRDIRTSEDYDKNVPPQKYEEHVLFFHKRDRFGSRMVEDVFLPNVSLKDPEGHPTKVLDLAAGTGLISRALSDAGYDVTASDLSKNALTYLEGKAPHIHTIHADMNEMLPFKDESFQSVTTVWGNRFIKDVDAFTHEVRRVLKPGGTFIWPVFTFEAPFWKLSKGIFMPTMPGQLAELMEEQGFGSIRIESAKKITYLLDKIPPHAIPTYLIAVKGDPRVPANTIFDPRLLPAPAL